MKAILVNNNDGVYTRNDCATIEDWEDVRAEMSDWIPVDVGPLTGWEDDRGNWTRQVTYEHPKYGCHVTYFVAPNTYKSYTFPELTTSNLRALEPYLRDKIDNYYHKLHLNGGITGHMISIYAYGSFDQHLVVEYAENHDGGHPMYDIVSECSISWYADYTPEQLYYIWMTDAS